MDSILFEKRDRIALITLNRPQVHNAINLAMGVELFRIWTEFQDDPELWVAIITGAGDKAFSSGVDLHDLGKLTQLSSIRDELERKDQVDVFTGITRNLNIWKPKIAAIQGYCLGGGLELALACELRIAADNAQFGFPEVGWGSIAAGGGTQRLPRLVPVGIALELLLTGKFIDADEAYRIGLVNKVVKVGDVLEHAFTLAERICRNAPLAVRITNQAVWNGLDLPLSDGLRVEAMYAMLCNSTEDAREGVLAFQKKRKPEFKGK